MDEAAILSTLHALSERNWPPTVPRTPQYPLGEIPLSDCLREWARRQPDVPAVVFYGAETSYAELDRLSDRFAALIAQHGAKAGDRIAVFLPNCPQFLVAFFGVPKAGCVHVPVNPLFKQHELLYELNDAGAEVILAQDQLMALVEAVRPETRLRTVMVTSLQEMIPERPAFDVHPTMRVPRTEWPGALDLMPALREVREPPPARRAELDALAALNYTSGTTGMPKGCEHTQRDMVYTAAAANTCALGVEPREVCLCFAPVFWIAGEDMGIIFPVFAGATCVLMARWDPVGFMQAVERYRVSQVWMLVDSVAEVLDHPEVARYDLRSLRKVSASSLLRKMSIAYRDRWCALTGGTLTEPAYGMTETQTFDTFTLGLQDDDLDLKAQPTFVGLPMPGTEILIRDFETGVPCRLGRRARSPFARHR
jgi:long-chain acyl-CoA synthetase